MLARACAVVFGIVLLATPLLATPCFTPAPIVLTPVPVPAPVVVLPRQTVVVIAEVAHPVIDYSVRDIFVFSGAPLVVPAGATVGISGTGSEVLVGGVAPSSGTVPSAPRATSAALRAALAEDEAALGGAPAVSGYVRTSPASLPAAPPSKDWPALALASLRAGGCASCHSQGSAKGGVTLFASDGNLAPGIDWRRVLAATIGEGGRVPAMPPRGRGVPLSEPQLATIRRMIR